MANYTLQSHGGEGLYMTADGTPTARRNVYIKARVSDSLDQTWRIDSPSNGARTRIFSCKSNNTGGYALNNATGTNNCDIISHISERGGSPLCGDKPSAERTRPQGCISAPFVPKGLFAFPALGAFFQISPRFLARQGKPEKGGGFMESLVPELIAMPDEDAKAFLRLALTSEPAQEFLKKRAENGNAK